ncbi:FtsB family cell division protein [Cellulosimicrobium cellulans]|uniref:FtsB family cell division protein n=1 Tax=Cellulosimicrobium cellulans TaxID=1710 RepID=UPI000B10DEFC|nr:septum formation initiator family protein [Cellulosimicrobium cellulans]
MPSSRRPPSPGSSARPGRGSRTPSAPAPRRPQGPAPEDRRRSRYGFLLPEVVTVRTLVLSVVVLLAAVLVLPTVRAYVNQTNELRALRTELSDAQSERDELQAELERWDDRAYVERQARDRLNFVMPGERPWRVLDPETVVDDVDPRTGQAISDGPVEGGADSGAPWYQAVWESVQVAGRQPVPEGTTGATSGDNG